MGNDIVKIVHIERKHNKTFRLSVRYDTDAQSPRDWDNLGIMACWDDRYNVPNETGLDIYNRFDGWQEFKQHLEKECDAVFIHGIDLYAHSGVAYHLVKNPKLGEADGFSGCICGFIYITRKKFKDEYGVDFDEGNADHCQKLTVNFKAEIDCYGQYANGEVYGWCVEQLDYNNGDWIPLDSCWGYYEQDEAENEGKDCLQDHLKTKILVKEVAE